MTYRSVACGITDFVRKLLFARALRELSTTVLELPQHDHAIGGDVTEREGEGGCIIEIMGLISDLVHDCALSKVIRYLLYIYHIITDYLVI